VNLSMDFHTTKNKVFSQRTNNHVPSLYRVDHDRSVINFSQEQKELLKVER
jgi:hypothetical protein